MPKGTTKTRAERLRVASSQRREHEKQELRQAILTAAGELFLERGYEHFSLRQVAERIGYSATTIYLYFKDKDDLLFTVVDEGFLRFGQQLSAAAASTDDPLARLDAMGQAYLDFGLRNKLHYQLMFMQRTDFLMKERPGEDQPRIDSFGVLQQAVQQALDAGALQPGDVKLYSDTLWSVVHGPVALAITVPFVDDVEAQQSGLLAFRLVIQGLATR